MKGREFGNTIAAARKKLGISQMVACELIGISDPSTLSKWENGVVIPGEEMVAKLMDIYEDPWIGYVYLQECTKIGNRLLPHICQSELDNLAVNFQYECEDLDEMRRSILAIARDKVVDDYEKPKWLQIRSKILTLIRIFIPMLIGNFYEDKKALQDGNLARAHA